MVLPGKRFRREGEQVYRGDIGVHVEVESTEATGREDAGTVGGLELEGGRMSRDPQGKGEEKRQMGI